MISLQSENFLIIPSEKQIYKDEVSWTQQDS